MTVVRKGKQVVLSHSMAGGNSYAIKLDADVAGQLGAELVRYSTKSALPEVFKSVGRLLADDATPH